MLDTPKCICGAEEQSVNHVIFDCDILRPPNWLNDLRSATINNSKWLEDFVDFVWTAAHTQEEGKMLKINFVRCAWCTHKVICVRVSMNWWSDWSKFIEKWKSKINVFWHFFIAAFFPLNLLSSADKTLNILPLLYVTPNRKRRKFLKNIDFFSTHLKLV